MSNQNDLPDLILPDLPEESDMKPWEQRIGPGMSGGEGSSSASSSTDEPAPPERLCQELQEHDLPYIIDPQMDLTQLPQVNRHTTPDTDLSLKAESNEDVWQQFISEQLYDTRRITLEHFHLFEWFPLTPGKFHTHEASFQRQLAMQNLMTSADGRTYFNPWGKSNMLKGGVGAVRLRPRQILNEPHYFMTASSTGVCHQGFPVLIPRRFYGPLKARILNEGAVPVTLSGEMRYVPDDTLTFLGKRREIPLLYLHVDDLHVLPIPRPTVNNYYISVAISFIGRFDNREGQYATYATFSPAQSGSLQQACEWLEQFYVTDQYKGVIITDFDEVRPRFPQAVFGLPNLMAGKLNQAQVAAFLQEQGLGGQAHQPFIINIYKEINTQGGAYIEGDVYTSGGNFINGDRAK